MSSIKQVGMISAGIFCLLLASSEPAAKDAKEVQVIAPGWGELNFDPPPPGSYDLPALMKAPDGEVLLADGTKMRLDDIYGSGKISILSFIYTSCDDVNGCPLSTFVLHSIKNRLRDDPDLSSQLRMISLSFDPIKDTPEVMGDYGKGFEVDGVEWFFSTTESEKSLRPILDAYGQFVIRIKDEADETKSSFAHMLRVYLIDKNKEIRNIYSVDFLHPDVLLADIRTLLLEERVL